MNTKIAIESLAMDLRRVAQSYYRGSHAVGCRFSQEALKRVSEINMAEVRPYIQKLLLALDSELKKEDTLSIAESSLLMSTLFQNYARKYLNH
jgi:hypothetical protein